MRTTQLFNHDWLFIPEEAPAQTPDERFQKITLPHTNVILPHHNFDDAEYQFISTYRKRFTLPEALAGRRLFVDFEGAMVAATVSINGHTFPEHKGGYTPFSFDLTDYIDPDGENLLTVHLDSTERADIPPFGYVVDYLTFGGIYRDVHLRYVEPCHIANEFIRPRDVLSAAPVVEVDVHLYNAGAAGEVLVAIKLSDAAGEGVISTTAPLNAPTGASTHTITLTGLTAVDLWTLDKPTLYHAEVTLIQADAVVDEQHVRFGFREAAFRDDGFYLNGEHLKLIGLNRHQIYPYIGAAAPARLQRKDADLIKYELACNIVRTSHYPQSRYFLDRCDEIGLLVFEEIPGWQHIGDADWQAVSLRDVRAMIERDWNHPSIIIWGVRINESLDNTEFYTATNALARQLDPTRPTGGVRFWQHSEFLEDVYTFNDFSNSIEEPVQTPHLITEFNGHMFPTKTWDNEERLMEHGLRHARIQSRQMTMGGVAGAIGWCAFDYNTHKEFGSGDRICYHGVMDMFRLPKYAAHFYASQTAPEKRIVMEAASIWSMGDRSAGGNDPLVIFSNCDEIEVFIGDDLYGRYQPAREQFPGLPHAPYQIPMAMVWGQAFHDLRLVGYHAGEAVAERRYAMDGQPQRLMLTTDDAELTADGMDMTRLVFRVVDQYDNRLPYATKVITFEIDGPAELIGENPFPLVGGQAALFVKAGHQPGEVRVRAHTARLAPAEVTLTLV